MQCLHYSKCLVTQLYSVFRISSTYKAQNPQISVLAFGFPSSIMLLIEFKVKAIRKAPHHLPSIFMSILVL